MKFNKELFVAQNAAIQAGRKIMKIYESQTTQVTLKSNQSPLTQADLAANTIIVEALRHAFPNDGILTEEEKDTKERLTKRRVWIIDPLDGTKEFITRNGEFTVNIALVEDGSPVIGVIYVPVTQELFYAHKNAGAFLENKSQDQQSFLKPIKLTVSNRSKKESMILIKSRSHSGDEIQRVIAECKFTKIITSGSSIKGCLIAKADADLYIRFGPLHEWDVCAMNLILSESGGIMTSLKGQERVYNQNDTLIRGFCASNNTIHQELLTISQENRE